MAHRQRGSALGLVMAIFLIAALIGLAALLPVVQCPRCHGHGVLPPDGVGATHEVCCLCNEEGLNVPPRVSVLKYVRYRLP